MSTLTEGKHPGEFLLSEANGTRSREAGILSSGQTVVDGQVLKASGSELVVAAGTSNSAGSTEDIKGIYIGPTLTAVAADTRIAYIARDAEVKDAVVKFNSGSFDAGKKAVVKAELLELGIICRDADGVS